jgi:hypothetical protein
MPYTSKAQQGLFHSKNSPVSKKVVEEFDEASKGKRGLPEHAKKKAVKKTAMRAAVLADNGEA